MRARTSDGGVGLIVAGLAVGVSSGLVGCASSEVDIVVCGDVVVPGEIDAVRVSLRDMKLEELKAGVLRLAPEGLQTSAPDPDAGSSDDGSGDDESGDDAGARGDADEDGGAADTRDAGEEPTASRDAGRTGGMTSGDVRSLPVTVTLPIDPKAEWIRVEGLGEGVVVMSFDRHYGPIADGDVIPMQLESACLRVACDIGLTCVGGSCVQAPLENEPPRCGGGG